MQAGHAFLFLLRMKHLFVVVLEVCIQRTSLITRFATVCNRCHLQQFMLSNLCMTLSCSAIHVATFPNCVSLD